MNDYLSLLQADAALLSSAASAASAAGAAVVPTCPDWKVPDLLDHVAGVYHRVEAYVRTRAEVRIPAEDLPPAPGFEEALAALVETLSSTPPDSPVWNWSVNQPKVAAFYHRRMACETAVHRVDAQSALGPAAVTPVDTGLALDALEELLDVILVARATFIPDMSLGGTLHLHCTDVEGEWLVGFGGGSVDVTRAHGKGDAAVRGTASDVLLWAYNRLPAESDAVEVFGDADVLTAWRTSVAF